MPGFPTRGRVLTVFGLRIEPVLDARHEPAKAQAHTGRDDTKREMHATTITQRFSSLNEGCACSGARQAATLRASPARWGLSTTIDWERATSEATALLREYLRIDTSNPPGNEAPRRHCLADLLTAEGIPFETAESAPGRSNLIARLGPAEGGVCLLNHTDVVPVEREFWDVDPFAGELIDGSVWGRSRVGYEGHGSHRTDDVPSAQT